MILYLDVPTDRTVPVIEELAKGSEGRQISEVISQIRSEMELPYSFSQRLPEEVESDKEEIGICPTSFVTLETRRGRIRNRVRWSPPPIEFDEDFGVTE